MSKFIGKMISVKKNQNTMTQWVRSVRDMAGVGSQDEDEEEALSLKDELKERVEVRKKKRNLEEDDEDDDDDKSLDLLFSRKPFNLPTQFSSDSDSDEDEDKDEVEVVRVVERKKTARSDEPQIIKITPPPKKKRTATEKRAASPVFERPHTIHRMACYDGSSTLTVIPGGFIDHWILPSYIVFLHEKLYHQVDVWVQEVSRCVKHCKKKGLLFKRQQHEHVLGIVEVEVSRVRDNIRMVTKTVIHSMNIEAIQGALMCNRPVASLIHFFSKSKAFSIEFLPDTEDKRMYDINTVFSDGNNWSFGSFEV